MTTYTVRAFKAKASEILRGLEDGEEVIITRRGKPWGRLTAAQRPAEEKPSLRTLRGSASYLPDADYKEFLDIKSLWNPQFPASGR